MAEMEPWQRVWIDANTYQNDIHSYINCTACHKGSSVDDMELAHKDMVDRPASNPETCGSCHTDVGTTNMNSLHSTLQGYDVALYTRSIPENHASLEAMQANHCNSCHTTCGDCHVSQPWNLGGGLLKGHTFVKTPPMSQTCTGCHGSRVKNEYFGLNEGYPSDVHFRERMDCADCHTANSIHGVSATNDLAIGTSAVMPPVHRYDGAQEPSCESCHKNQIGVGSGIEQHELHGTDTVSCQTCHSVAYTNCTNCHVSLNENQLPFFKVEQHSMGFYIGKNPLQNAERPYKYVTLRHAPIDPNSFSFYGENLLPNFAALTTWKYSTPHNIQRNTPQTESCTSCHSNDSIFLTADKVDPRVLEANRSVIVEKAPPLPPGYEDRAQPTATATQESSGDDFWGGGGSAPTATPSTGDDFWGGGGDTAPKPTPTATDFWGN